MQPNWLERNPAPPQVDSVTRPSFEGLSQTSQSDCDDVAKGHGFAAGWQQISNAGSGRVLIYRVWVATGLVSSRAR